MNLVNNRGLVGRVALITGGARGQGRSHALTLAEAGADVVVCDICAQVATAHYPMATEVELRQTVADVEALGRRAFGVVADVRSSEQMAALADQAIRELGRVDILVANAGIVSSGRAHNLTEAQWDECLDINLKGAWLVSRYVIPHMIRQSAGRIILIASTAGVKGLPNAAHYAASKHGLIGLMRTLAMELGSHDINVNAICPTSVETPMVMNERMFELFHVSGLEAFAATMDKLHLLKRGVLSPKEISAAVLFLASDAARSITGAVLPVDAGFVTK